MDCLWLLSCYNCRDDYLQQKSHGLQSQNLLFRPLQKKFRDTCPRGREGREGGDRWACVLPVSTSVLSIPVSTLHQEWAYKYANQVTPLSAQSPSKTKSFTVATKLRHLPSLHHLNYAPASLVYFLLFAFNLQIHPSAVDSHPQIQPSSTKLNLHVQLKHPLHQGSPWHRSWGNCPLLIPTAPFPWQPAQVCLPRRLQAPCLMLLL